MLDGVLGDTYNIGFDNEKANLEIVKLIVQLMPGFNFDIISVNDRLGHDFRYSMDSSKIEKLGFMITNDFDLKISETIQYYKDYK
jgi:dTDP-glucose 4,6-dehydratase